MSGDFDKEAERERLREKYDSEADDREVTERMSQLLLQGATMTNQHCETCGSPIFRYQGQEFCPTCQGEAEAGNGDVAAEPEAGDSAPSAETQSGARRADPAADESGDATDSTADRAEGSVGGASTGTAELGGATRAPSREQSRGESAGNGPTAARESLAETVTTLSNRARQTEDPHRAKALLEAAREAAETMAALEGE
jgi:uncharacterized Zn finger protein (UPF0148 family)